MATRNRLVELLACAAMLGVATQSHGQAQSSDEDLATQLSNPVASLISVLFQFNWDHEFGPDRDGRKFYLNIQPVASKVSEDWNWISRVIVPIVDQHIPFIGDGSQSGVGDTTDQCWRRGTLLGRQPEHGSARLGRSACSDGAVSNMTRTRSTADVGSNPIFS